MRSFPSTYDRADLLMSAGCSTFVSAALILVIPRVGIILLEILLGLFFIGCALAARARLRIQARSQVKEGPEGSTNAKAKWFDRYDVLMILISVLVGTIAKQHHVLDLPDWFLEWVSPFLLMAFGYKAVSYTHLTLPTSDLV